MPFGIFGGGGGGGGGSGGSGFPLQVADGSADASTGIATYDFNIAVAGLTLPGSHYVLIAEVHEQLADGQLNTAASGSWGATASGLTGAADDTHPPTGLWVRIWTFGTGQSSFFRLRWAILQIN